MLQQLRSHSRNFIIWILFGIIIAVFIISFGPQADAGVGCTGARNVLVLEVDGKQVDTHAWRFGMQGRRMFATEQELRMPQKQRAEVVMDSLLLREILAQAAERAGFRVSTDLVNEKIMKGELYILGRRGDGRSVYFRDGAFDYELLENLSRSFNLPSVEHLLAEQRRELLAVAMREMLMQTQVVSRDEALTEYTRENTTATVDAVAFRTSDYRRRLELDRADLDRYLARHGDEVRARYDAEAETYKGVGPQVQLRQIFFARTVDEHDDHDDHEGHDHEPIMSAVDEARTRAEAARARIAGGEDFAAVARAESEDQASARKGGALGWRSVEAPGLGAPALTEAVGALQPGEVSEVLEAPRGYYILQAEAHREGDLSFDQVKHEIGEEMAAAHYAREAARRDASAALARARAGENLDDLFERGQAPAPAFELPPGMEDLPPEMLEQLMRQMQELEGAGETGSRQVRWETVPASWTAQAPAALTAILPAQTATAAADDDAAAGEQLPAFDPPEPPKVRAIGPFPRSDSVPTLGRSTELVDAIFTELETGELAPRLFEVEGAFVLVQLVYRQDADLERFAAEEDELRRRYALEKSFQAMGDWAQQRCHALVERRAIGFNKEIFDFRDEKDQPLPVTYQPCSMF